MVFAWLQSRPLTSFLFGAASRKGAYRIVLEYDQPRDYLLLRRRGITAISLNSVSLFFVPPARPAPIRPPTVRRHMARASVCLWTLQKTHLILMWVAFSSFGACATPRMTYVFLLPLRLLLVRDTSRSGADLWSKKPLTASSKSSASMLGSMSTIFTSILGMS